MLLRAGDRAGIDDFAFRACATLDLIRVESVRVVHEFLDCANRVDRVSQPEPDRVRRVHPDRPGVHRDSERAGVD